MRVTRYQDQPGTTLSAVFTAEDNLAIATAVVCNDSALVGATLTIHIVPNAGTAGDDNIIYNALDIASGETVGLSALLGIPLPKGSSIHMSASVADQLSVSISTDDNR